VLRHTPKALDNLARRITAGKMAPQFFLNPERVRERCRRY